MRLAGAGVADQAERLPLLHPLAGRKRVDDGGIDVGISVEVELPQRLLPGEGRGLDPALGAAPGPVVALGQQQFGEEGEVGHLLAGGLLGQVREFPADGRQPEHPAGADHGGFGRLLAHPAAAGGVHGICSPLLAAVVPRVRRPRSWS